MTLKHLRIFLEVYNQMNITRAAENLHMTQPAVTRAIHELEDHYHINLFDRINHRLYITDAGENLYSQALHILNSFDHMEKNIFDWGQNGILRVGSSITIGNFILPDLIRSFQETHPDLKIQVQISNTENIQQNLLKNNLDLALLEGSVDSDYLHTEEFFEDHMVLVLPPSHPLAEKAEIKPEDIAACPLLLRERGSAGRSLIDHYFAILDLKIDLLWESASTQALIQAVAAGLGISLLPEALVRKSVQQGTVISRSLSDECFDRKNYIVWHKQKYLNRTVLDFIKSCHCLPNQERSVR